MIFQYFLVFDGVYSQCKNHGSVHDISEHNSEKEWKCDSCEYTGIYLLISWNSVCVGYLLSDVGVVI